MKNKISTTLGFFAAMFFSMALSQAVQAQGAKVPGAPITGLRPGQISFSVENLDKVTDFYVKLLGFKVVRTAVPPSGYTLRTLAIPGFAIDLVKMNGSTRASWPYDRYAQQGYVHFAFYMDDVSGALKVLQAAHADVKAYNGANGKLNRLIINDPEGNQIELFIPPKI